MATYRKTIFATGNIYHIYNRGIDRRPIFTGKREYQRAKLALEFYQYTNSTRLAKFLTLPQEERTRRRSQWVEQDKRVDIIAYCLMPNHFHLLLRQKQENGITRFVSEFSNSYTKYFNTKHQRTGPLLEGLFKDVLVETDEQLLHLNRYIHLNPTTASLTTKENFLDYQWSSLREYYDLENGFCTKQDILNFFSSLTAYQDFLTDQIDYARTLDTIKHLRFDKG